MVLHGKFNIINRLENWKFTSALRQYTSSYLEMDDGLYSDIENMSLMFGDIGYLNGHMEHVIRMATSYLIRRVNELAEERR